MTTTPELPAHMAGLPKDKHGRPVPAFVEWIDGEPDFRVMRGDLLVDALRFDLCWVCGKRRGRVVTFTIGPMCAVNRTTAEPPAHLECAIYSALACPFLSTPTMRRRETGLPEERFHAGEMIRRNPGVTLLWTTRTFKPFRAPSSDGGPAGFLIELGDPVEVRWYTQSRAATRDEVMESIKAGLPALANMAEQEGATAELNRMVAAALPLVPAA